MHKDTIVEVEAVAGSALLSTAYCGLCTAVTINLYNRINQSEGVIFFLFLFWNGFLIIIVWLFAIILWVCCFYRCLYLQQHVDEILLRNRNGLNFIVFLLVGFLPLAVILVVNFSVISIVGEAMRVGGVFGR